jgi:F-type H+-transporting ATPase subunit gamma
MSDSPASLRRQIGSAADLQSVVRAMKAQAAANVGQYAQSVAALGDYAATVDLGLGACLRQQRTAAGRADGLLVDPQRASSTALQGGLQAAPRAIRAVVFGSDQGLVGRFNDTLLAHALQSLAALRPMARVWAVGDRMRASLADNGLPSLHTFAVPGSVQAIAGLVGAILAAVVDASEPSEQTGTSSELHLFYNRPTTGAAYAPVGQRLLPLDADWHRRMVRQPWPTKALPGLLGSPDATLRGLVSEYLFVSIFRASAESLASENASRLAAMERADRNIDKMLGTLRGRFHRLRQSRIDEELSDVISGFKALRGQVGA